ncbi:MULTISPECIES: hypothetical protein [Aphanothece]|uniref:hypothetical protein n=1 Tax=Aphanothece TaxID=1121 RepID=UPI003985510B
MSTEPPRPGRLVSRGRLGLLPLLAAAGASVTAFGAIPQDGALHPMALLASLLPLQLAALFWATAVARPPGSRPPASG